MPATGVMLFVAVGAEQFHPLLSNVYLTPVDRMLERAKEVTSEGHYTPIEYARFADDGAPRRREGVLMTCVLSAAMLHAR